MKQSTYECLKRQIRKAEEKKAREDLSGEYFYLGLAAGLILREMEKEEDINQADLSQVVSNTSPLRYL